MSSGKIKRNSFCRLCLKKHNHLMDIFEDTDEDQNDISKYINLFFAVEITKSDHFSTHVCKPCWDIIVCTCKSRIEFRNNDLLLQNCDNETALPIKLQEPVRERQHKSVENILQKYSGIILDSNLWHLNLNPAVNLSKCRVPSDSPYLLQLHQINSPKTSKHLETTSRVNSAYQPQTSKHLENSSYLPQQPQTSKLNSHFYQDSQTSKHFGGPSYLPHQPQTFKHVEKSPRLNSLYQSQVSKQLEKPSPALNSYLPQQPQTSKQLEKPPYFPQQPETSKHLENHSPYLPQQPQSSKHLVKLSPELESPYLPQTSKQLEVSPNFDSADLPQQHQTPKHSKKSSHRISRYHEDPDFDLSDLKLNGTRYSNRSKNKLNYSESEAEFTDEEEIKLSDSEIAGRNKRNAKRPRIFGSPLYIPDNELDDITLDYYGD